MKYSVGFVFAIVVVAVVAAEETPAVPQSPKFTTKYDDVSLDEILKSDRLLNNYFDCLVDSKPCTPDGNELKKAIPLALKDDCKGCSEKQKVGAEKVIKFLVDNKPELWKTLEDKYDPEKVYSTRHADFAAKKGIKLTPQTSKFTTKYDDVSLDEILKSDRLLNNYFDCLVDTKPCTADGMELKKAIPLALKDECKGCSEKQKVGAEKVIKFLVDNKPELWKTLEDKYDPEKVYSTKHADFAAKKGIKLTPQTSKFTTKYDDISLDEILKSDRLLNNYFDCLIDTKPCTPDGYELKMAIPLALKDDCKGCSEKQKAGAEKVIKFLSENKPEYWKSLEDKYDPEKVYRTKHSDFAAKKGIKV